MRLVKRKESHAHRRFPKGYRPRGLMILRGDLLAVIDGRTIFPKKVISAHDQTNILRSGYSNRKIGRKVLKGRWAEMPIYTLTLEERATCPRTCHHWRTCYGHGMPWAIRTANDHHLIPQLQVELTELAIKHAEGFVVRLHVLGDFYSIEYALAWECWIGTIPQLRAYGSTAHSVEGEIGKEIRSWSDRNWDKFAIRTSLEKPSEGKREAITIQGGLFDALKWRPGSFLCSAQKRDSSFCGNCTKCWTDDGNVMFLEHGAGRGRK